jgi:hypothetical protein
VIAAYLAALLAVDTQVELPGQLALGGLTWLVLLVAARPLPAERRAQVAVVICGNGGGADGLDSVGRLLLPAAQPADLRSAGPWAVFMAGLSLSEALRRHSRALVAFAAAAVSVWGLLGLTVLPRLDAAGALCIPLLLAFLWRSRARAAYAGVFLVVAALELYGTAIGTWRWAEELPGLGIPDGNPPSGVAAGYVWFDVMALLFAPRLLAAVRRTWLLRRRPVPGTGQA